MRATLIVIAVTISDCSLVCSLPVGGEGSTHAYLAPRAFASEGSTCYWNCPASPAGYTYGGSLDYTTGGVHYCVYVLWHAPGYLQVTTRYQDSGGQQYPCGYDTSTGAGGGGAACAASADFGGCGTGGTPPGAFKRRTIRIYTPAEEAIRKRQHVAKRSTMR
ncbi:hypothetical protein DB88DRAFT_473727 [Papiliotrema laurentii]|uniref:Uncharacterized protein n=1 Tax=Papiliotrema laurentii TaxID=5418 RepID=A0AAD9CYG8_PAPLA|nr:hypothetical protein DB88DRAFT_473727 [Papiliotrema laurentii]